MSDAEIILCNAFYFSSICNGNVSFKWSHLENILIKEIELKSPLPYLKYFNLFICHFCDY